MSKTVCNQLLVGWLVGLWSLTSLSIILQLYPGGQLYRLRKSEEQEKTINRRKLLTNFNVGLSTPRYEGGSNSQP